MVRSEELLREVPDEDLEAHIRKRITPEFVEFLVREWEANVTEHAKSSAVFNFTLGKGEGKREIVEVFKRLLSEATDPEFQ